MPDFTCGGVAGGRCGEGRDLAARAYLPWTELYLKGLFNFRTRVSFKCNRLERGIFFLLIRSWRLQIRPDLLWMEIKKLHMFSITALWWEPAWL